MSLLVFFSVYTAFEVWLAGVSSGVLRSGVASELLGTGVASGVLGTSVASKRAVGFCQSCGLGHGDKGRDAVEKLGKLLGSIGCWQVGSHQGSGYQGGLQ